MHRFRFFFLKLPLSVTPTQIIPVIFRTKSIYCKIFIYMHKNLFAPQAQDLLEKLAEILLYNFHREHILLKLKTKKLLRKIKSKNLTAGVLSICKFEDNTVVMDKAILRRVNTNGHNLVEDCRFTDSSSPGVKPLFHRACHLAATSLALKKNDIHREVAKVAARFYKGCSKVADQSPIKISHHQPFEYAQKTSRKWFRLPTSCKGFLEAADQSPTSRQTIANQLTTDFTNALALKSSATGLQLIGDWSVTGCSVSLNKKLSCHPDIVESVCIMVTNKISGWEVAPCSQALWDQSFRHLHVCKTFIGKFQRLWTNN